MGSYGIRGLCDLESTSKVAHLLDSLPLPRVPVFYLFVLESLSEFQRMTQTKRAIPAARQ